jgi:hypothetical protein
VIKFFSDLRQVGGFLRFPLPIKLTATITEILLNAELNTINQAIRCLQKMEQSFNKGVDSEDKELIMKNILYICRHPKYEVVGSVRMFFSL